MRFSPRLAALTAPLLMAISAFPGCSPDPAETGKMDKGKMEGPMQPSKPDGGMDKGKMDGMDKGKMDGMDKGKMDREPK
jgi:hypothetical protein